MKSRKTQSVEHLRLTGRFELLRKSLLSGSHDDCFDKPLAHWTLPTDRRMPLALLGKTLGELLACSYDDLAATPGIGQKKLGSLLGLLDRIESVGEPPQEATGMLEAPRTSLPPGDFDLASGNGFDPTHVSEVVWHGWQETVRRHGLEGETLGRLAPSLQRMTHVVWQTRLEKYCDVTLAELRGIKTHGEKRVHSILEVFYHVNKQLGGAAVEPNMRIRLVPRNIDRVERWIGRKLQTYGVPSETEIRENYILPLMEQVRIDAANQVVGLAESRLGLTGPITSVRQVARSMGITRARVYQLLNEVNDIMQVRWPNGRHQGYELRDKLDRESEELVDKVNLDPFQAALELFYPGSRRGAAGPLEADGAPPSLYPADSEAEQTAWGTEIEA